ncbi:MAG TPA: polyamine aminopropyltransferase [Solirubrobacteraceae bacterium]|nr:polyamine aminopropyltransferase [Solirubrobacteraceae bacterium]
MAGPVGQLVAGTPRARSARRVVLAATFVCAVCGFAYELVIVALGTVLMGSSTAQTAMVLGTFVAAMGAGSLLAARVPPRLAVPAFAVIEAAVALLGGLSALGLFAAYAWLDLYEPAVRVTSVVLGALVGAELPLLAAVLAALRREDTGRTVGTLLAADYVGAFAVGVTFPLVILPALGQIQAALAFGAVNALAGGVVLWALRGAVAPGPLAGLAASLGGALAAIGVAASLAGAFEVSARQALYDDPIALHVRSEHQDIVVTERGDDVRLVLNGDLQFSSVDEHRYHEALVHPAMTGPHESVLVLGGGDGLALREVLRYPDVRRAVEVDLDGEMLALARDEPALRTLNRRSLADPRVSVVTADAFSWLREASERFDVVIVDLPDPDNEDLAKLYSVEMYGMLARRVLAPGGRAVVQSGSPYFAPEAYWSIERSLRAAGLRSVPYHVDVPSFGDWGFHLAAAGRAPRLAVRPPSALRFLDAATLRAAAVFPADRRRVRVRESTLNRARILEYQRRGWQAE